MIGIIAAMPSEMAYFKERIQSPLIKIWGALEYRSGILDGHPVVVAECGVGKVNAAMHTQLMIDHYPLTSIIQTGIAGSLCAEAGHLSIVIGNELLYHDMQRWVLEQYFPHRLSYFSDPQLVRLAEACAPPDAVTGRIATGDIFVDDNAMKSSIRQACNALCCEMEGAAVAQTATLNALPFVIIRCISDLANDAAGMTFSQFEHLAAEKAASMVHKMVLDMHAFSN